MALDQEQLRAGLDANGAALGVLAHRRFDVDPAITQQTLAGVDEAAEAAAREWEAWVNEVPWEAPPLRITEDQVRQDALDRLIVAQERLLLGLTPAELHERVGAMLTNAKQTTVGALTQHVHDVVALARTPELALEEVAHRARAVRRAIELLAEHYDAEAEVALALADAEIPGDDRPEPI